MTKLRTLIVAILLFVLTTTPVLAGRPIPSIYTDNPNWLIQRGVAGDGRSYSGDIPHYFRAGWATVSGKPRLCYGEMDGGEMHSWLGAKLTLTVDGNEIPLVGPFTEQIYDPECGSGIRQWWYSNVYYPNTAEYGAIFAEGWHIMVLTHALGPTGFTEIPVHFCIYHADPSVCNVG